MKTGLVLEGGGVRGIYTAGVLDTFMKYGITFDGLIGVSAGAIHGCSFLSSQRGRSIDYYMKYYNEPKFMSFKNWLRTGDVVDEEFAYHELPEKLVPYDNEAFLKNETPFYAVCTNVESGLAEYIRINDMFADIDILRASASLPYFSRLVEFNGNKYLDGGCADSIPSALSKIWDTKGTSLFLPVPQITLKARKIPPLPSLNTENIPNL